MRHALSLSANDEGSTIAALKAELREKDRVISTLRAELREVHAKRARRKPKLVAVPAPTEDPRLPSNTRPHVPNAYVGGHATPAQLAKHRRAVMEACGCRLCALCLNPPQTFAESAELGLDFSDCQPGFYSPSALAKTLATAKAG